MKTQRNRTQAWLVLLCACALGTCGCFTRQTPAKPMIGHATFPRPVMPAMIDAALEAAPDMPFEEPVPPPQLVTVRSLPARPHVAPVREPGNTPVDKTEEPTIAPELTTQESETAKAETQRNLDLAEKNLAIARGRTLNSGQQDLVSKIRGFTESAREAMRSGDWVRAKNVSKKAVVLSEQLASSF